MSRSIHTTRRDIERLEAFVYGESDQRDAAIARASARLEQKRRIKDAVARERRRPAAGTTCADAIPVVITEREEHVHHMASVEDVRSVLRRLPPGVLDGLTRIELQLGAEYQTEFERDDLGVAEPDPLVGRLGSETFPGVYAGRVLGTYSPDTAVIRLNAYVFDANASLREVWEPMVRLSALSTLVHEVGHHFDHTMRVARGRWLAQGHERVEMYAEDRQHVWLHTAVVPHLRATDPAGIERLESWIGHHGGVRLALETLADDPRATYPEGRMSLNATVWSMQQIVQGLVIEVSAGQPLQGCRVAFARDLHYREMYDDALESLELVLSEEPENIDALTLRADILVHQGHYVRALAIAEEVSSRAPDHADAWKVIADACEGLERWTEMHAAANRLLALYVEDRWRTLWALMRRARASLHLGDLTASRDDLARLEREYAGGMHARRVSRLRAEIERVVACRIDPNEPRS